jgi:hypothetical protein
VLHGWRDLVTNMLDSWALSTMRATPNMAAPYLQRNFALPASLTPEGVASR